MEPGFEWTIRHITEYKDRKEAAINARRLAIHIRPLLKHVDLPPSRTLKAFIQQVISHKPEDMSLADLLTEAFVFGAAWQKVCLLSNEEMAKILESYEDIDDLNRGLDALDQEEGKE